MAAWLGSWRGNPFRFAPCAASEKQYKKKGPTTCRAVHGMPRSYPGSLRPSAFRVLGTSGILPNQQTVSPRAG